MIDNDDTVDAGESDDPAVGLERADNTQIDSRSPCGYRCCLGNE